jgi:glucose/arabinose dehydrogenase
MNKVKILSITVLAFASPGLSCRSKSNPVPVPVHVQASLELAASGFTLPVHITHAGDGSGRLFVVEQCGRIMIVRNGVVQPTPFLDVSAQVSCGDERGLLSIAFPPGYAEKGHFYICYTDGPGDIVVARYGRSADPDTADPATGETLLVIPHRTYANHNGGQLAFGPDGYLYLGTGDGGGGGDPEGNGQDPASLLGKILRIDVESGVAPYAIPPNNPFVNAPGFLPEIWALGLRNPWRFSFDRLAGDLYIADVGQASFEEVNFQPVAGPGGANYGWNIMEGAHCFGAVPCDQTGLTLPVHEYGHSQGCSITGGFVFRGPASAGLSGKYIFGDYCSGRIWALQQTGGGWSNILLADTGYTISSFGEDEAGNVYAADHGGGAIYRLVSN